MPNSHQRSNEFGSPSRMGHAVHRRLLLGGALATTVLAGRATAGPQDEDAASETKPSGPQEADWSRDYDAPSFKPSWKNPQVNRELAADFVIFAHSEMKQTKMLLDRYPEVLNAAVDWGAGDYETALGGASHMGRHDIVELLLERGARPDLFTLAMLGELSAVKSLLTLQPKLIDAKGPHGFSLHFHAQVGGERSEKVLEYLQSVKEVPLRPIPFLNR